MKPLAVTGALLLAFSLAGCAPTETVAPPPAADQEAVTPGEETPHSDCGGLTTENLASIFGVELSGPEIERGSSDQNGTTWTNSGCDWEHEASELEIDLDISGASDFPDGSIICIEPGGIGEVTTVDGIGVQAWWKFDDFDEVEGELRVCTDDSLVELAVDAQSGSVSSDQLREKVTKAIRLVIG